MSSKISKGRKVTTKTSKASTKAKTKPRAKIPKKQKKTLGELEKALEVEQQKIKDLHTKIAYLQAENQNTVKIMERQQRQSIEQANRNLILELLPILDDLTRSVLMMPIIKENQPFIDGLNMVIENLHAMLKRAGVKPIETEGQLFDPLRHEAITRQETAKHPPNTILEELRKGYLLKGTLLRPSLVKIAVPPIKEDNMNTKPES